MIRENNVLERRLSTIEQLWERKRISDWEFEILDTAARMIGGAVSYGEVKSFGALGAFWDTVYLFNKPKEFDNVLLQYQRRLG